MVRSHAVRQFPYCENFFKKSEEKMTAHVKCCAGQAAYFYVFNNSIVNYQENFNKIGNLPFSIYYNFETTTGSAIYHDAKMYTLSYCRIVAFHANLNMPRTVIYRAYDQSLPEIRSLAYLEEVKKIFLSYNYHNRKTRQQLEDYSLFVFNKSRNMALAEMFNIELKFVCDALQKWFAADLKKVEIHEVAKFNFLMHNVPQICEIFDFPIDRFAETGWFQHVCSAEYLYLENIYSKKDMFKMNINEFEDFLCKVKKVLDNL